MVFLCSMTEDDIRIVPYEDRYHKEFRDLNEEWITQYFELEALDRAALEHPHEHILDKGGFIVMGLLNGEAVGTCALIKSGDDQFELAKMAVTDRAKGKGIGLLLGLEMLKIAKEAGAGKVILLSNRKLLPALTLYRKLGFEEVPLTETGYKRANIKMEITF